jgi:hypothetical protein
VPVVNGSLASTLSPWKLNIREFHPNGYYQHKQCTSESLLCYNQLSSSVTELEIPVSLDAAGLNWLKSKAHSWSSLLLEPKVSVGTESAIRIDLTASGSDGTILASGFSLLAKSVAQNKLIMWEFDSPYANSNRSASLVLSISPMVRRHNIHLNAPPKSNLPLKFSFIPDNSDCLQFAKCNRNVPRGVVADDSWKDSVVIYQLSPKLFASPFGAESGTFESLTDKLDYLSMLKVTMIW